MQSNHRCRSATLLAVALGATTPALAAPLGAQQPNLPTTTPSEYRAPTIVLAQPGGATGHTVPQDRPVVLFRFAAGEPADPVDARSLAVVVDGEDRSALFQVVGTEAWGSLARPGETLAAGAHQIAARICSARGACAAVSATVDVVASPAAAPQAVPQPAASRRGRLIDALLAAARRLLDP